MRPDIDTLRQQIQRILEHYPAVQAAYLFGSYAEGKASSGSDIDLALVGPAAALQESRLDILADLTAEGMEPVDLVLLNQVDTVLRFEIVHHNCVVYTRPDFDHGDYFSRTLREYFDLEPYLRIQRQALKERLLNGQS